SSRRRHTRFSRDWSSDVCSSDLTNSFFQENNPNSGEYWVQIEDNNGCFDKGIQSAFINKIQPPHLTAEITGSVCAGEAVVLSGTDRKSTRLNSSHVKISYAVFCL